MKGRKQLAPKNPFKPEKKFDMSYLDDEEEIRRLMKRVRPAEDEIFDYDCYICRGKGHYQFECPCRDKIPPGTTLTAEYDQVCNTCGKIGEICGSEGAYARLKFCGACIDTFHWYWELMCDEGIAYVADLLPPAAQNTLQEDDQLMVDIEKGEPSNQSSSSNEEPRDVDGESTQNYVVSSLKELAI